MINVKSLIEDELHQLRSLTSSDFTALAWEARNGLRLQWLAVSGNSNDRHGLIMQKPGRGLVGMAYRFGRSIVLDAASADRERLLHESPIMLAEQLQSAAAVPVRIGDEVCGVLLAGSRFERVYRKEDVEHLVQTATRMATLVRDKPV